MKDKKKLKNKLWKLCSEYIRRRDNGVCFTCGIKKNYKETHAGHFIHGKSTPIYYNSNNINCQCIKCNTFLDGNRDEYLRNIQRIHGIEFGDWLMSFKGKEHYYTLKEIETLIEYYKNKLI